MPSTLTNGVLVIVAILGQTAGGVLMPATRGFAALGPTLACLTGYFVGVFAMCRLIQNGMNLSIVVPVMVATVPLAIIAAAFFIYHEPASLLKISLLIAATIIVVIASMT